MPFSATEGKKERKEGDQALEHVDVQGMQVMRDRNWLIDIDRMIWMIVKTCHRFPAHQAVSGIADDGVIPYLTWPSCESRAAA